MFNIDYNTTNQLPSALGLVYSPLSPSYSEASAYSVSGNLLHLNTVHLSGDQMAYYQLNNGYDHTSDADFVINLKVSQMSSFYGFQVAFADATYSSYFVVTPSGWSMGGLPSSGTFADTTAFHTFELKTTAATHSYELFLDTMLVSSGLQTAGFAGSHEVTFGDATPTGGNLIADIQFIRYNSPSSSVPEPSSIILCGLGASIFGVAAFRRRLRPSLE